MKENRQIRRNKKAIYKEYGIDYDTKTQKIFAPIAGGMWIRPLLVDGNKKIGKGAFHFSTLPTNLLYDVVINGQSYTVKGTCPCCCQGCYARTGNYRFKSVIKALAIRTILARDFLEFVENAILAQIEADNISLCRIHAAGDFFGMEYAAMWKRIAEKCSNTVFWTYTKNRDCENLFDGINNANIVKSIIPGFGFNFGHCDYIMTVYKILKDKGYKVHICFCGIEKHARIETKHCTNCHSCAENDYVLFIEHSTEYKAEQDPLFPELVKMILAQE